MFATGETHSVREFVEAAFKAVDLPWEKYVKQDTAFDRPIEPARLVRCADEIRKEETENAENGMLEPPNRSSISIFQLSAFRIMVSLAR